jgi:hypothetical protein
MSSWNYQTLKKWCWQFIVNNSKLPTGIDLSTNINDQLIPSIDTINHLYGSVDKLIYECGPTGPDNGLGEIRTYGKIREGFDQFIKENGHYPSANEIDSCKYLGTARSIQRSWGGLVNLRKVMGLEVTNYGIGKNRSTIAFHIGQRSFREEFEFEKILIEKFGEVFVHNQKRIGNVNVDFFVYSPKLRFGIDVFDYKTRHDFTSIVNSKQKTYKDFPYEIIFLPMCDILSQTEIDRLMSNKINKLPINCSVLTRTAFTDWIENLTAYPNPLYETNL